MEDIYGAGGRPASSLFGWYILLPVLFFLLFLFIIFLIPFLTLLLLASFTFTAVFGIVTTSTVRPGASHVPSFYAPTTNSDRWSRMAVFALFGVIFGGLHCIGWSFEYPTHSEQTLWQATSLAITVIPLIVAPIDLLLAARLRIHDIKSCKTFERTALLALDLIMTILLFIYVPARLCLIALALALLRNPPLTALVAVDWTNYKLSSAVGRFVGGWFKEIFEFKDFFSFGLGWCILLPSLFFLLFLFTLFLIPFLSLLFLVSFIFTAVFGIVTTSTIHPGASHVPSFYAPVTKSDRWSRMVVFALFGAIFGGLHCIGWYFKYPTHSEQTLWQATSLAITVIPLIVAPIDFLLATRDISSCQKFERRALLILDLIMTILLFVYVPARLSLIAQALALLREQPSSALVAVDWTKYVPHLLS